MIFTSIHPSVHFVHPLFHSRPYQSCQQSLYERQGTPRTAQSISGPDRDTQQFTHSLTCTASLELPGTLMCMFSVSERKPTCAQGEYVSFILQLSCCEATAQTNTPVCNSGLVIWELNHKKQRGKWLELGALSSPFGLQSPHFSCSPIHTLRYNCKVFIILEWESFDDEKVHQNSLFYMK